MPAVPMVEDDVGIVQDDVGMVLNQEGIVSGWTNKVKTKK